MISLSLVLGNSLSYLAFRIPFPKRIRILIGNKGKRKKCEIGGVIIIPLLLGRKGINF